MKGERRLIFGAFRAGGIVLIPAAGIAWALRGGSGALAVVVALAIVVANLAVSGLILVTAARRSPENFPAIALPSYAARMIAVFAAMAAVYSTRALDHPTFTLTFAVGLVAILTYECFLWAHTPWLALEFRKELP